MLASALTKSDETAHRNVKPPRRVTFRRVMSSYCREEHTIRGAGKLRNIRPGSHLNYAIYHDRYQRTGDGWKFTERVYEVRYLDTSPLAGSPPQG